MTFSLFFLSAFTVPSLSSSPGLALVSALSKTLPSRYLFILFVLSLLFFFHSLPLPNYASSFFFFFCSPNLLSVTTPLFFRPSSLARLPRSRPVSGAAPCARLRGLTPGQVGVCRSRGEVMESVRKAAEMVIEEVWPENTWSQGS